MVAIGESEDEVLGGDATGGFEEEVVIAAPVSGDASFPAPATVLVTVDTSPLLSSVVGNSITVMLPPIPVVTTVIVRVMLVDPLDDVDPVVEAAAGDMLLLLLCAAWPMPEDEVETLSRPSFIAWCGFATTWPMQAREKTRKICRNISRKETA